MKNKREKHLRRKRRVRAKISGTKKVPRLSVFKSNAHIYAQIINDITGITLVSFSDLKLPKNKGKLNKTETAKSVGEQLAKKAKTKKIKKIVFDRAGYKYHGRIKALAEGARKGGLVF